MFACVRVAFIICVFVCLHVFMCGLGLRVCVFAWLNVCVCAMVCVCERSCMGVCLFV